jgi:hypothetical protein
MCFRECLYYDTVTGKSRNRANFRNARAKYHISTFDRANLVMTNIIWAKLPKPYTDFYRKGKTVVLNTFANIKYK